MTSNFAGYLKKSICTKYHAFGLLDSLKPCELKNSLEFFDFISIVYLINFGGLSIGAGRPQWPQIWNVGFYGTPTAVVKRSAPSVTFEKIGHPVQSKKDYNFVSACWLSH